MMKVMRKFGGAIFLYAVIFFGIVAITTSVKAMSQEVVVSEEVLAIRG